MLRVEWPCEWKSTLISPIKIVLTKIFFSTFYNSPVDCGVGNVTHIKFYEVLEALYYFEMMATGISVAVLLFTLGYLVIVERLRKTVQFLEAHVN